MRRIVLAVVLTVGLTIAPLAAEAQAGKTPRIGFLGTATPSLMAAWLIAFREGLSERGYVEGQNIAIEYRWGDGKPERFAGLVPS
jgi:putative tryptophan/tyrosine transport system substrate-binding protein